MSICWYCGMERVSCGMGDLDDCDNCRKMHKEDMQNHHYPPGFVYRQELTDADLEQMSLAYWKEFKWISNEMRAASSQSQLDRKIAEQKDLVEKLNRENQRRVESLTPPKLDFSKVTFY